MDFIVVNVRFCNLICSSIVTFACVGEAIQQQNCVALMPERSGKEQEKIPTFLITCRESF